VERGIEAAAAAKDTVHLPKLLSLAATVANLRGDYARAAAYGEQLERLGGEEGRKTDTLASGGRLVVAMSSPVAATEPASSRLVEETEVLGAVFETLLSTDADGTLVPALAEEWSLADGGRSARLRLRPGLCFSDGVPFTAAAAKTSLERAIRLRPDGIPAALAAVRGAEEHRKGESPEVPGIRAAAEDRLEFAFVEPLPVFPALLTDYTTAIARAVPIEQKRIDALPASCFTNPPPTNCKIPPEIAEGFWTDVAPDATGEHVSRLTEPVSRATE